MVQMVPDSLMVFSGNANPKLAQAVVQPVSYTHLDVYKRQDQIALTEIEAPPFHEEVRAAYFADRLRELGLTNGRIDREGNVIGIRPGKGNGPRLVLGAHLDTVFPAGTNVKVRREGTKYYAPGISDDARGLAVVLEVLRTLQNFNIQTEGDLLFSGSVGEEQIPCGLDIEILKSTQHL